MSDRPAYCCGACPAVEPNPAHIGCEACRTGYDCTCRDNPNCPNYQETTVTNITDQDRRLAREWADMIMNMEVGMSPDKVTAARVILATVDAPAPTLAEELREEASWAEGLGGPVHGAKFRALADRAEQMEHDLTEARAEVERAEDRAAEWQGIAQRNYAEVERLTAKHVTDPSLTLNDGSMMRPATVAREENVSHDLPEPADVKPGEVWKANIWYDDKRYPGTAIKSAGGDWVVIRDGGSHSTFRMNEYIELVAPLVPEVDMTHILTEAAHDIATTFAETLCLPAAPRVITDTDELDTLAEGTIVRGGDGHAWENVAGKWCGHRAFGAINTGALTHSGPVTVLWEPEVAE